MSHDRQVLSSIEESAAVPRLKGQQREIVFWLDQTYKREDLKCVLCYSIIKQCVRTQEDFFRLTHSFLPLKVYNVCIFAYLAWDGQR
jgi:hypothetical protein